MRAVASIPDDDADEHFRSQSDYVTSSPGRIAVDFVGRYETLNDDFAHVAHRIGLPPDIRLPRLQTAPRLNHAHFYTAETRGIVATRYANDIELFEYQFRSD